MQEFNLKDIWENADARAETWYRKLRPELEAMARRKNDSVLQRIRRLVLGEVVFSVVVLALAAYYLRDLPTPLFVLTILFFIGVMAISYRYYMQFSQEIGRVPTLNIVESTSEYLRILSNYKNRLLRLSITLMPIGLVVGFFAGFGAGANNDFSALQDLKFWIISIVALTIVAWPSYLLTKWYYRFFLGSKEKELEQVLARLNEEEEE